MNSHAFHIPFENVFLIRKHLLFSPFNRVRKNCKLSSVGSDVHAALRSRPRGHTSLTLQSPAEKCVTSHRSSDEDSESFLMLVEQHTDTPAPSEKAGAPAATRARALWVTGSSAPARSENSRQLLPGLRTQPSAFLQSQLPGSPLCLHLGLSQLATQALTVIFDPHTSLTFGILIRTQVLLVDTGLESQRPDC